MTMRTIIIEDEKPAAEKLSKALLKSQRGIEVMAILNSVAEAVHWLQQHPAPDLVFMDIELTDGASFRIFEQVTLEAPVIFTTAYDEYWQEAFEHNSIDYLLKPIKPEKLEAALDKYERIKTHFSQNLQALLQQPVTPTPGEYKKRFLVKKGSDYQSIRTEDIAYFYAMHKLVCLVDTRGQKFILDVSLAEIEKTIDPALFFRVNRKFLVQMNAIKKIRAHAKSKLLLELEPPIAEEVVVSQENASTFKSWMGS